MEPHVFGEFRALLEQGQSVAALRGLLFVAALGGGCAWLRRAPRLALTLFTLGAGLALSFWLVQIRSPFGLGTDSELTRQWAQAGVNAAGGNQAGGYVWGTVEEPSMIGALARFGLPLEFVFRLPQWSALLSIVLALCLPLMLIRNREAALFASCIVVSGGLWPGTSSYESLLLRPSRIVALLLLSAVLVVLSSRREVRRRFQRSRMGVAACLLGTAVLSRAINQGGESETLSPLLLLGASMIVAPSLRALLRRASTSRPRFRALEALLLVVVAAGSGLSWADPPTTLRGFWESRASSTALSRPLNWVALNVPPDAVVLASREYSSHIAALGGRRVLFPSPGDESRIGPLTQPFRRARLLESTLEGQPLMRLAEEFGATHLFLGPGDKVKAEASTEASPAEPTLRLVLAYQDSEDFRLFRLTKK